MRTPTLALALLPALLVATMAVASAQTGTLRGTVLDSETNAPLFAASVLVTSLRDPGARVLRLADRDGNFEVADLPGGTYEVRGSHIGYATFVLDEVTIAGGAEVTVHLLLVEEPIPMESVIISASRREEKVLDAPASVQVVDEEAIEDRSVLTPADHLKALPAVDVARAGLNQGTVVVRGFNNVFSGATLTLVDNRIARVPSLRYNALNFIPTVNEDIQRIEVVSGPGSALYGPNAANGVIHIVTRSPFDYPGTSLSVSGGERDLLMASGRHAGTAGNAGYRVSASYYQGDDFRYVDPVEAAQRADAILAGADPSTLKIGARDYDVDKVAVDGRLDYQPDQDVSLVLNGGFNQLNAIELTGLGAAQAKDYQYLYGQVRLRWRDLFWQAYLNRSDAGETFNLRTGADFIDQSSFFATQLQHQSEVGDRETLTYGVDVQLTRPNTDGTINGRNENDDDINELGVYVQSETQLHERWWLTAAGRFDDNNRLEDPVFSPRAALVFGLAPGQKLRATYNRAFSTPTPNNYFLDLLVLRDLGSLGAATGMDGYDVYTKGVPEGGFTFRRDTGGGIGGLYMQVPEAFSPATVGMQLPADATLLWDAAIGTVIAGGASPALKLIPAPTAAQVPSVLRVLNPTTRGFDEVAPEFVQDVGEMQPTITNTFEVGYKGLLGGRFMAQADVWHSRINDFIGPLRVETPNVFLDPTTLGQYLSNPAFGINPTDIPALVAAMAAIPLGTVTPDGAEDPADLFLTYRNFGDVDLTGLDLALSVFVNRLWTLGVNYSYTSKDFFEDASGVSDIALNAPRHKAGARIEYRDEERGFHAGTRARFIDTFPVLSGAFNGTVEYYTVFDVDFGWTLPGAPRTKLSALVQNVFDNEHREFVGVPEIGRVGVVRLTQTF